MVVELPRSLFAVERTVVSPNCGHSATCSRRHAGGRRFVEETDDGEKSPEDAAREYVEQERARVLAAGSVYDAELVREFVVALSRRVGWSGRVMEQVVTKLRAVGLSKMEQVTLA